MLECIIIGCICGIATVPNIYLAYFAVDHAKVLATIIKCLANFLIVIGINNREFCISPSIDFI